jgi:hypothetical protein
MTVLRYGKAWEGNTKSRKNSPSANHKLRPLFQVAYGTIVMASTVLTCSGGEGCRCQRFIPNPSKPHKCIGCKHPESFHPITGTGRDTSGTASTSNVSDILARYSGLERLHPKASEEDARKETNYEFTKTRSETKGQGSGQGGATKFKVKSISSLCLQELTFLSSLRRLLGRRVALTMTPMTKSRCELATS